MRIETKESITMAGRAASDAKVYTMQTGNQTCAFSVVSGTKESPAFRNFKVWKNSPFFQIATSILKGDSVFVCGEKPKDKTYTDKNGEVKQDNNCTVEWLEVMGKASAAPANYANYDESTEDELPF
jgi:hypothetical protein